MLLLFSRARATMSIGSTVEVQVCREFTDPWKIKLGHSLDNLNSSFQTIIRFCESAFIFQGAEIQ